MSDDLVKSMEDDLRIGCSASIGDTQKAVAALKSQAAEITRLRARVAELEGALEGIKEYWNGSNESAVDAAEECRYRSATALGGGKDE